MEKIAREQFKELKRILRLDWNQGNFSVWTDCLAGTFQSRDIAQPKSLVATCRRAIRFSLQHSDVRHPLHRQRDQSEGLLMDMGATCGILDIASDDRGSGESITFPSRLLSALASQYSRNLVAVRHGLNTTGRGIWTCG